MAYMKKPSKKMYGGNKKTGSFLEPNKELSFGGVKTMKRGGTSSTGDDVNKKAEEAKLLAANEKAKKQHKVMAMTHATTPGLLKTLGKGAGTNKNINATKGVSLARPAAKPAVKPAAKTSSSYADAKKKNPNLDKLIKERKGLTRGTVEYNRVQNQINKAYGKGPMRKEVNKVAPKPATKNPERNPTIKSSTPAKPAAKPAAKKPVAKVSTKPTASRTGMSPQGDTRALQAELKSAAPAASAKKPIDRRTARSARKTDRLKKRVGRLQGKMQAGGLKDPSDDQKGLKKLPTSVRNKMGYMKKGGKR